MAPTDTSGMVASTDADLESLEGYRKQLTGYCYRMLGSGAEAEDAVQETMIKAWRGLDRFEGRSSLKSWLFRIAHNVCLDMIRGPQRRARPMDLGPSSPADAALGTPVAESAWVQPIADSLVLDDAADPADVAAERESIRLAFIATLQHLPARQRAVFILREVLRWQAREVAELLGTSVASVNSALQRARATLDGIDAGTATPDALAGAERELLGGFLTAFEHYDVAAIVSLLRDDVEFSMPPYALWLRGPGAVAEFLVGTGKGCEGSRLVPVRANGAPGFACYHRVDGAVDGSGDAPEWAPWAIQVFETDGEQITGWHNFLHPELFSRFGVPERLTA